MNMAAVPGPAGGPVGGMMMMNSGSPAQQMGNPTAQLENVKIQLNTYIYEYLLKIGMYDVARQLHQQQDKFKLRLATKPSPGQRKNGEVNGVDPDAMDMDMKMDIPDDIPRPECPQSDPHGPGFLFEWFGIFSDMLHAARPQNKGTMTAAAQYLNYTQNAQRMRENQQNPNLIRQGMMNNQYAMRAGMRPGMVNGMMQAGGDLNKRLTPQQVQAMKNQQMQAQQNQREQGEMDVNGRPGTPADGENGGSPSKRPRLENPQFNGGMMPNGRPIQNQQAGMLMQTGFNPNNPNMNPQFRQNGGMPGQKPMQPGMPNGMMNMNMNNAGSPMMAMNGAQFAGEAAALDMYNAGRMGGGQPMQGGPVANAAQSNGNHALQDYQMQLMLLEQQNKKRLMMARQEQDNAVNRDGAPMPAGIGPAGMSPSGGSRSGASPNPTEQMKRNAQLGGLPGSPAAGENMQGRSPAGMNFMNGMPADFNPNMFMENKPGMVGPGGQAMRPPTSMDMNMARQQGRMGGQFQGGQPMVQQPSQPGQQPMGTPGQREMPPPSAPAGGNAQRNQPTSPAQSGNAPPTPSQSNKANPKGKKGKADANNASSDKKRPAKKNSTANAPAEAEPPVTPTPSTPITAHNPGPFGNAGAKNQAAAPTSAPQPGVQQMPPNQAMQDMSQANSFSDFNNVDQTFNLDFSTLDNADVLENFDFDSFLNTSTDDAFTFDNGMAGVDLNFDGTTE